MSLEKEFIDIIITEINKGKFFNKSSCLIYLSEEQYKLYYNNKLVLSFDVYNSPNSNDISQLFEKGILKIEKFSLINPLTVPVSEFIEGESKLELLSNSTIFESKKRKVVGCFIIYISVINNIPNITKMSLVPKDFIEKYDYLYTDFRIFGSLTKGSIN